MTHKTVRVKYIGVQQFRDMAFPLYNLLEPMGEHPVNSTVSHSTILTHGFKPLCVLEGNK